MGLSNEERWRGLMYATEAMTRLGKDTSLKKFTSMLWPALLGGFHNSAHWVLGSSAGNKIKWDAQSAWAVGVFHHTDRLFEEDFFEEHSKDKPYDVREWFEIPRLLQDKGAFDKDVCQEMMHTYEIFQWTEQAVYNLRRYEDKFMKDLRRYDVLLSQIQGQCFTEFKNNEGYANAYVVHNIMEFYFVSPYPYQKKKWNKVVRWIDDKKIYFDMNRCMEMDLEELGKIHISLDEDKSEKNKVLNLAKLMVRRLHKYKDDEFFKKYVPPEMFVEAKKMYDDHENKPYGPEYTDMTLYGLQCMWRKK